MKQCLEVLTGEQLPEEVIHGTQWRLYEPIRSSGLLPQCRLKGKGGVKGGEGRKHIHFTPAESDQEAVLSGMRSSATMAVVVNTRKAASMGVRFLRSRNGVILGRCVHSLLFYFVSKSMLLCSARTTAKPLCFRMCIAYASHSFSAAWLL